ncbi:MAG: hypothetical protein K2I47_01365 [Odoribacter sp.]|nr:hypothetical protein [Odoribacter sp.]
MAKGDNFISCPDIDSAIRKCKELEKVTGEICDAMQNFCSIADDTQKLGANIAEAMPVVVSLRETIKQAQNTCDEHVKRMGGYLALMKEDSEQSIDMN